MPPPLPIAVLLSGSGTTLENLFERIETGRLAARVTLVLSSRSGALGLELAGKRGVRTAVVRRRDYDSTQAFSDEIFRLAGESGAALAVLAGFMALLTLPRAWEGRVVNIHPALIPAFCGKGMYGHHVHEAVIEAGVGETGCTVHFLDNEYDHGPIIAQEKLAVEEGDTPETLGRRVQAAERELYPRVIQAIAEGRLSLQGRIVRLEGTL